MTEDLRSDGLGSEFAGRSAPRATAPPALEATEVHVLAGLPTERVCRGFERAAECMPVVRLEALGDADLRGASRVGVLLPPFVEPSWLVESWEDCDFLGHRFEQPARIASVSTLVDADQVMDQLASTDSLSSQGWGARRTINARSPTSSSARSSLLPSS